MELAARIGAKGILIDNREGAGSMSSSVKDLWEAAQRIAGDLRGREG